MEANTVILSLSEYNSLRDFRENQKKNKTCLIVGYDPQLWCGYTPRYTYITSDMAVEQIAKKNTELLDEVVKLKNKIYELENPQRKEPTLEDIKKMSIWKFMKWRKTISK